MKRYPKIGDRIRWTNVPERCKKHGDEYGIVESIDGCYHYCRMDGTNSIVELYPNEIEILSE